MPIYSMNKLSSVGATHFAPNESYVNEADANRMLYESYVNDQTIFEAILMNDFNEVVAMREGTMVESEIRAMNEISIKGIFESIKEKLKKAWEKIKSVFRAVYAKLSVWFVRNGKAFVAMHRNTLMKLSYDKNFKVPDYRLDRGNGSFVDSLSKQTEILEIPEKLDRIEKYADQASKIDDLTKEIEEIRKEVTAANFYKEALDTMFYPAASVPIDKIKSNFPTMMEDISNGGKKIRELKKAERETEKNIRNAIKSLDKIERGIDKTTDEGKDEAKQVQAARKCASTLEVCAKTFASSAIKIARFSINQDRRALGYCVAHGKMNESAMLLEDVATEDDIAQLDDAMESPTVPDECDIPEEAKAIINIQVDD